MASRSLTIGGEFRKLRAEFSALEHPVPGLFHCWFSSRGDLPPRAVEQVIFELTRLSVVAATRWPNRQTGAVDTSCFFGHSGLFDGFQPLAARARRNLVSLLKAGRLVVRHSQYEPVEAWMADLLHFYRKGPESSLSVRTYYVCQWWPGSRLGAIQEIILSSNKHLYKKLVKEHGEPLVRYLLARFSQDVVTMSIAMIDDLLRETLKSPEEKKLLDTPAAEVGDPETTVAHGSMSLSSNSPPTPSMQSTPPVPERQTVPHWVNEEELIGPCSLIAFAKMMDVSDKTLYRRIKSGDVWKKAGPAPKRFYFAHRDPEQHRILKAAYESRPKK
jgi:hypothetical protein